MKISELFELSEIAKRWGEKYSKKRFIYNEIINSIETNNLISLIGPRGCGKTVILRQILKENSNSLYISMDSIEYGDLDLFELIKDLNENYKINLFLLDEIHFLKNYDAEFKKIYDFLDVKVIFTSSVSLSLYKSSYDLSRRVKTINIYPLSFREFIYFKENILLEKIKIDDILTNNINEEYFKKSYLFEKYICGGLYPLSLEKKDSNEIIDTFKKILQKIINIDIPRYANLNFDEISKINNVIKFIGLSHCEDINYSSVSKNIGITKYKSAEYLKLLENSFLINIVMPYGTNVLKEPKILMALPYRLIYKDYNQCIGSLREDYVVGELKSKEIEFYYLKSTRGEKTPDYIIFDKDKKFVIEIGGKGKGRKQFKGFKTENKVILSDDLRYNKKPIYSIGFL